MAELASTMTGMLLPNHFQPLDHDSESDDESMEYGGSIQIPFSSMLETSDSRDERESKSSSPNVSVEYLPHMTLKQRTEESWNHMDSSNLTNDSGFTPNSSGFSADLSSSGGFSSCDLSFNLKNSSMNRGEPFRTQQPRVGVHTSGPAQPVTPTKLQDTNLVRNDDPLTPTANLKMLLSAMSPEIRNMENKKKKARLFEDMVESASQGTILSRPQGTVSSSNHDTSTMNSSSGNDTSFLLSPSDENGAEEGEKNNRKAKSLGLLCQKFLTKYPDYPKDGKAMDISLDQISKDLNVERRRIYDIVNVLESVEMVSRRAKNRYLWHGRTHLYRTLAKLKCLGQRQKFAEQLALLHSRLEDGSLSMDESKSPVYGPDRMMMGDVVAKQPLQDVAKLPLQDISNLLKSPVETEMRKDGRENWEDDTKRDKTLGVMSQKFIMLFLVCKDRIISLDVAARILKGDQNYQIGENAKFKTKVRRLYDIANILTSLKLIEKIHLSEGRSRKPAFRWIGPDPDTSHVDWSELPTGTKPTQKHSYFPLPPVSSDSWSSNATHKQTPAMVKLPLGKTTPLKSRLTWSRTASFSAICEVAEQECRKYSSAPSSPVKDEEEDENEENSSSSTLSNGTKKEEDFIQEFQALRNKYPACVSRLLFSGPTATPSDPSPLTPDPAPLTPESLQYQLSPRDTSQMTTMGVASPRGQAGECNSASKTKAQKVVYVQRFVPLLNANTIAAVQASTSHHTDPGNPTIVTGNRTIVAPNSCGALVSGPRSAVISPTPGSVIRLLPMRQENWVQLPHGNDIGSRNAASGTQHETASSVAQSESGGTQITCAGVPNSNQLVTIIRRSKRAVKLALDKEFEYHPIIKKVKSETNVENPPAKVAVSEPAKNPTVIITHPTPLVSMPEGPHPQAHTPAPHPQHNAAQVETGQDEKSRIMDRSQIQETPLVRNDSKLRRAALKHVKRRLTIDLDKEPSETTDQDSRPIGDNPKNASKKMPRCHSLSELDQRKSYSFPDNGLIVPYLETNSEILGKERERTDASLDEVKRKTSVVSVSREHNYSSHSVKMKFGGKFGSLKKSQEDAKSDIPGSVKTSRDVGKSSDSKDTDRSSSSGEKFKGTLKDAQGMKSDFERTEQRLSEMDGKVNLEDCWLSASFPPPSLSGFPTFLQGRTSRGTPRPGSSRPSSVVSIGELDRWLFPGDNASLTVTSGQVVKTVSTPWVLSPTVTSTHSSPPKLTTLASPGGHGVALASPRPVLPQTNHHMYLSPHRSLVDANAGISPEPLFTSTPKPSTASIKYFNSDFNSSQRGMESVSYSGDETTIPCPQDCHEDLGKLKPLEGIPLEQQSAPATMSQSTFQKLPETEHVCPKVRSGGKCTHLPAFGDGHLPVIMSTSCSQSSALPPYLMRSKAAASRVPDGSKLLCKPMVHPAGICSSGQGLVNMEQVHVGPTSVQRLPDLQSGDSTKDSSMNPSASLIHHVPLHQLQAIPASGEAIKACHALTKPNSSLQSLPRSPHGIPVVSSGLGTGPSKLWKSPSIHQIQQRMQQRIPQSGIAYTLNGTTYTIHVRPRTGNPTSFGTSSPGCLPPLSINPTTTVSSWKRCHQEAVCRMRSPLGVSHPLQEAPGPAPGCTPRFATQNPDSKAISLASVSSGSRVNGVIAREACSSSSADVLGTVPQHRPWTFPYPVVQGLSVSGDTLPPRQTNCNDFITLG